MVLFGILFDSCFMLFDSVFVLSLQHGVCVNTQISIVKSVYESPVLCLRILLAEEQVVSSTLTRLIELWNRKVTFSF